MSIKIHIDSLTVPERSKIVKELKFSKKESKYNKFVINPIINPYDTDDDDNIYLPFYWALHNIGSCRRPNRDVYYDLETNFNKEIKLRANQKIVKKEVIEKLNKDGSCIFISLHRVWENPPLY